MEAFAEEEPLLVVSIFKETIVGIVVFLTSFFGMWLHAIVAFFTSKLPTVNNPFGRLIASQSCADILLFMVFFFYVAPMATFNLTSFKDYSAHAGSIILILFDVTGWHRVSLSVNRFFAMVPKLPYTTSFSRRNTSIVMAATWLIPIITGIVFKFTSCDFAYSSDSWTFTFADSQSCELYAWKIGLTKDFAVASAVALLDVIIFIHFIFVKKYGTITSSQQARKRKEINFYKQAVLQAFVFDVQLLIFYLVSWRFENRYVTFALGMMSWILFHTAEGAIMIAANREFRKLFFSVFRRKTVAPEVSHSHSNGVHPTVRFSLQH